jgi:hypothetical protein
MNRFDDCIDLSNELSPCFVCTWNDGEIVQIHNYHTLHAKYDDTNLFENEEHLFNSFGDQLAISLEEWLIGTINDDDWRANINRGVFCDNFRIERIK